MIPLLLTSFISKPITKTAALSPMLVAKPAIPCIKEGWFDYMAFDSKYGRVYASHSGANTLVVYDIKTKELKEIPTGGVNGVYIVPAINRVYAGGHGNVLLAINEKTDAVINKITIPGSGDALTVDTKRNHVFICHDDHPEIWGYTDALKPLNPASIPISGGPEYINYSKKYDVIVQNIASTAHLSWINPISLKVFRNVPTVGLESPHPLEIDEGYGLVITAGKNGQVSTYNIKTGARVATAPCTKGVDQMAFDPKLHLGYLACPGSIGVLKITPKGIKEIADIPDTRGAHTITVDPKTHDVWICYATKSHKAYLQRFVYRGTKS